MHPKIEAMAPPKRINDSDISFQIGELHSAEAPTREARRRPLALLRAIRGVLRCSPVDAAFSGIPPRRSARRNGEEVLEWFLSTG